jgi:RimJ/RimL family protein N-acetyltransferase
MRCYSLVRLFPTSAVTLCRHIIELSDEDIYLRFGYRPSNEKIGAYITNSLNTVNTPTHGDFWFGIEQDFDLVATIHVIIRGDTCEFAFTTHKDHRGMKLGQLLFARGYQLATEYGIKKIELQYLSSNAPMRHIAQKFGLKVVRSGVDSDASIDIEYPVPMEKLESMRMTIEETKKHAIDQ